MPIIHITLEKGAGFTLGVQVVAYVAFFAAGFVAGRLL